MPAALLVAAAMVAESAITAPGPQGPLAGTLEDAGAGAPVVLIIPGSGPTDRDGNNPLGVTAAPYRHLAEALAERGVSSVRIDKRGLFESKEAIPNPNAVNIADYVVDTHSWARSIIERTGAQCVWLLGHSEGGLIAAAAMQQPNGICGVILVASTGRKLGVIIREQLQANPANAPLLDSAMRALESLEAGRTVDTAGMNPALLPLFAPQVQPFLIELLAIDPAKLVANIRLPVLIVQGGQDIQVTTADFEALRAAKPQAEALLLPHMTHVLKDAEEPGRQASLATYSDPTKPVTPELPNAIADFVARRGR
jgi:pimeloyl-ACP methyl ester carboxylesterase